MLDTIFKLGNKKYRVEKEWVENSSKGLINNISAISNDKKGNIYVLQRSDPFMLIFSQDGELINKWSNKDIIDGHYFEINSNGEISVVDRDHHRIVVLNNRGEIIRIIGNSEEPGGLGEPFNHPTDISTSINGDMFVSDGYGNSCVHHLNEFGELIHTWGKPSSEEGNFITPHSILVDQKERVLVADREGNRVQIFNKNGIYFKEINNLFHPMNIYEDNNGYIYITDQVPTLNVFNPEDELIGRCRTFGTHGHGVTVDENNNIYIAEMFPDGLTKLVSI